MVLVLCQIPFPRSLNSLVETQVFKSLSKFLEHLGNPKCNKFYQNLMSSLVTPSTSSVKQKSLEHLGNPKCNKLNKISLNSLVPPSASSFYIRSWNVEISHGSNFSCSVLSITGDTAKYLDFIIFCRSCTLYPHDTLSSCCHQWPLD